MSTRKTNTEREAMREASSKEERKSNETKTLIQNQGIPFGPHPDKEAVAEPLVALISVLHTPCRGHHETKGLFYLGKTKEMMNPVSPKVHPLPPKKARNSPSRN